MGGEICKSKDKERGLWYEVKCIKAVIASKEARGEDANFEKKLLESWRRKPLPQRREIKI